MGDSEDGAFWTAFLRSLKTRGLTGVQLVISDAHAGLKAAIASRPVMIISGEPGISTGRPLLSKTYLRSEEDFESWYVKPAELACGTRRRAPSRNRRDRD